MRLFTAIDLPADVRARLSAAAALLQPLARLQWSRPEKLHITTRFIGEWPEPRLAVLTSALQNVKAEPFDVAIGAIEWMSQGRVLCAKVQGPPPLAAATDSALAPIGIQTEGRPYHPHLTLARRKDRKSVEPLDRAIAAMPAGFGTFPVSTFALYWSNAGTYTQLKEFSFT